MNRSLSRSRQKGCGCGYGCGCGNGTFPGLRRVRSCQWRMKGSLGIDQARKTGLVARCRARSSRNRLVTGFELSKLICFAKTQTSIALVEPRAPADSAFGIDVRQICNPLQKQKAKGSRTLPVGQDVFKHRCGGVCRWRSLVQITAHHFEHSTFACATSQSEIASWMLECCLVTMAPSIHSA